MTALLEPVATVIRPDSWLADPVWVDAFEARLRTHHALSTDPLAREQFEAAFNIASQEAGWTVVPHPSVTHRFTDTTISRASTSYRLSLKASSAKGMSPGSVHISKLTEAAGIQDVRRQTDRRDLLRTLFTDYRAACDGIVMLRAFTGPDVVRYQLVEIPTSMFGHVDGLTVAQAQDSTIPIPPGAAVPMMKIRVDRSDAKITLTGIRIEHCTIHGEWTFRSHQERSSGPAH